MEHPRSQPDPGYEPRSRLRRFLEVTGPEEVRAHLARIGRELLAQHGMVDSRAEATAIGMRG